MIAKAGKACLACGVWKPMDGFHVSRNADGRANTCRACAYARCQARRKRQQARVGTGHIPAAKKCAKCGQEKPSQEFSVYRASADGLGRFCRECDRAKSRSRRYGIPEERALEMAATTACESCGEAFLSDKHQHIDHRHSDGAVRGVLCHSCNQLIGMSSDRASVLRSAADYLDRTVGIDYRTQPYAVTKRRQNDTRLIEATSPRG